MTESKFETASSKGGLDVEGPKALDTLQAQRWISKLSSGLTFDEERSLNKHRFSFIFGQADQVGLIFCTMLFESMQRGVNLPSRA